LLIEAVCLFLGFFQLDLSAPRASLLFWLFPLLVIILLVYLSILDFRETSREIDHIFREASESILKTTRSNPRNSKARG
jgi:putative exporter of polyketide antibiotics